MFLLFLITVATNPLAAAQDMTAAPSEQPSLVQQLLDPEITDQVFKLRMLHLTKDELAELAKEWLEITRESVKQAADLNIAVATGSGPALESLRTDLTKRLHRRNWLLRKLGLILSEWSAKGASAEEVGVYTDYATAILRTEAHETDLKTLLNISWAWIISPDGGFRVIIWIGIFIGSLFSLNILAHMIAAFLKRSLSKRHKLSGLLREFLARTTYWFIFAIGAALVLSSMGVNLTPMMAAFGGASFIIGFATQSTLSNFVSGLLLMFNRPFDVGDKVDLAGVSGIVENVTTISTIIRDADNRTTIIPNKKVWESVIVNEGHQA